MKKDKKNQNFSTREEQENREGFETTTVEVPESRFQTKQQNVPADSANGTVPEAVGFEKKKTKGTGHVLKQEVAAHVVDRGVGGDIPGAGASTMSLSYGGNEGTILASAAYTPIAGQARSESRMGKKLDAVTKKINFVPAETFDEEFDESKPLAASPDAVQGYNGSPRNTNARSQKNNGFVPGELMFTRSLDEIKRDQAYFTTGQVIKSSGVVYADTPTVMPTKNAIGTYVYGDTDNYVLNRGNYLHRNMRIKFDATGRLTQMKFDVLDASVVSDDSTVVNGASPNNLIDMNYAEMDRQIMDHKAGDEKAEIWTPLARAVKQPTQTVSYLRDIENITGSEVFMAYKKTAACHSYQLNRAAKDGLKLLTPMAEACCGLGALEDDSKRFSNYTLNDIFSEAEYLKGSASLFLAAYDSTTKYKNKGDLLTQPRSFKLALQTADNNMNPLRVKSDFVEVVNGREVFSTIDRDYDPLQPICISDKAGLIHCYNFNELYSFDSLNEDGTPKFANEPFRYMYSDLRNNYVVTASIPLLAGMHAYLNNIGPAIVSIKGASLANKEIVIPMVHSTCFFSLWSLFVLSATPYICRERVSSLKDVLYYEKSVHEYPFHQLGAIKDANPMNALNYGNDDYQMPLVVKRMSPSVALSWVLPELFWPMDELTAGDSYAYVLPWYFNQEDFDTNSGTKLTRKSGRYNMSMPSVRAGVKWGYLDDIYGMDERQVRLALDRMVTIPGEATEGDKYAGVYKYSQNADGIPYAVFSGSNLTPKTYISTPRELGWFMVLPAGVISVVVTGNSKANGYIANDGPLFGQTSYLAKYWHGRTTDKPANILKATSVNVDRSVAYVQDWDAIPATNKYDDTEADWGFAMSLADILDGNGAVIEGKSSFKPFTNGAVDGNAETPVTDGNGMTFSVMSLQKAYWTRIQKLCMAISPWDARLSRKGGEDAIKLDIFDFLYFFGLSGFKASAYDEDVYNRLTSIMDKGFSFLRDPFFEDSSLRSGASEHTQVPATGLLK